MAGVLTGKSWIDFWTKNYHLPAAFDREHASHDISTPICINLKSVVGLMNPVSGAVSLLSTTTTSLSCHNLFGNVAATDEVIVTSAVFCFCFCRSVCLSVLACPVIFLPNRPCRFDCQGTELVRRFLENKHSLHKVLYSVVLVVLLVLDTSTIVLVVITN